MATNILPVDEIRGLLQEFANNGTEHLTEVEADLAQTTFLLSEAIEKLGVSFSAIHNAVVAQQKTLDMLLSAHNLSESEANKLLTYREKIAEEVGAAVTGLQFQDLTSQLIARTVKRVAGLRDLLASLDAYSNIIGTAVSDKDVAELLEAMSQSLKLKSGELSGDLRKSVNQKDMSSGDIELF